MALWTDAALRHRTGEGKAFRLYIHRPGGEASEEGTVFATFSAHPFLHHVYYVNRESKVLEYRTLRSCI